MKPASVESTKAPPCNRVGRRRCKIDPIGELLLRTEGMYIYSYGHGGHRTCAYHLMLQSSALLVMGLWWKRTA